MIVVKRRRLLDLSMLFRSINVTHSLAKNVLP